MNLFGYFESLKIKKIKFNKRGNSVIAYEFIWKTEQTGKWDSNKRFDTEERKRLK